MSNYPEGLKASLIARMLPPNNVSVPELVHETGIPRDTLYTWRRKAQANGNTGLTNSADELRSEEKFNVVLETASLNEIELFKRRQGHAQVPFGYVGRYGD